MLRKVLIWVGLLGLLGVAFICFGLWMREMMPVPIGTNRDTEIYSFDYLGHAGLLSHVHFVGYGRFRHPLFSWIMSLVTMIGHRVFQACGESGFWIFLCVVFSAFMLGCVALMYRCLRRGLGLSTGEAFSCTVLFVSFGHVWLLAGMPETYPVSLLLLLALLNWLLMRVPDRRLDLVGWGVLSVLMGGVTLTQGAKAIVAYCVAKRPTRRQVVLGALSFLGLVALVALVFYVRLRIRVHINPTARGMEGAIHELFDPLIGFSAAPGEWLHHVCVFFSEPIIVRGEPFDVRVIDGGYCSWIQPVFLLILYFFVGVGIWLGRSHPLLHVLLAMFVIDVGIHFVLGWGLSESQLYGAHWFAALPLCVGLGIRNMKTRRLLACGFVLILAVAILCSNAHGYFGHDVGLVWPVENQP